MKLAHLSPETRRRLAKLRFDRIVEKHEGPWDWEYSLEHDEFEFLTLDGRDVLLPVYKDQHANIAVVRSILSADGRTLTLFLTDTTYETGMFSGYLAVCEQVPGEDWYVALVYHEWFVLDTVSEQYRAVSG